MKVKIGFHVQLVIVSMAMSFGSISSDAQETQNSDQVYYSLNDQLGQNQYESAYLLGRESEISALRQEIRELRAMIDDSEGQDSSNNESRFLSSRQPIGRYRDDAFVSAGDFSGSVKVPGTAGSFRIGGAVLVNANFDFDNQGFQQIGVPPSIPLDGDSEDGEQQAAIHARFSQFNFDYRAPTDYGDLRVFLEFDMFGDGDEFTNDYDVRLRHAGVEFGNWRFGQYHSGFIDVFALPESADPESPLATPVLRQPGIYYMRGGHEGSNFGVGIENPAFDFSGNASLLRSESMPNFVAFARLQRDWGYIRLAGLAMQMRSKVEDVYTGGGHLSGRLNTPLIGEKDNIAFGIQAGNGFVHYYSSFVGGLDGVIADDGSIETTGILGAYLGYQHWWSDRWRSTFMASFFELDSPALADPLSYSGGERYTANLFWTPIEGVSYGVEYNWNSIETANGSKGDGSRIECVAAFVF